MQGSRDVRFKEFSIINYQQNGSIVSVEVNCKTVDNWRYKMKVDIILGDGDGRR